MVQKDKLEEINVAKDIDTNVEQNEVVTQSNESEAQNNVCLVDDVLNASSMEEALRHKDQAQILAITAQSNDDNDIELSITQEQSEDTNTLAQASTTEDLSNTVKNSEDLSVDVSNNNTNIASLEEKNTSNQEQYITQILEVSSENTVNWHEDYEQAALLGAKVAAKTAVMSNNQAFTSAEIAAVRTAAAGGGEDLQKAAALAAAAAAVGNSKIDLDVSTPNVRLSPDAPVEQVEHVLGVIDDSIDKLDKHEQKESLLQLSWPIFVELSLHFATILINTIMVGMVSVNAVAELTIGNQVFDLALVIFNFFNIGVCIVTAQSLGANNKRLARRVMHVGLGVNVIMSTIVMSLVLIGAGVIVDVMQVPEIIADSSTNYLRIISIAFLPMSLCLVCSAILRAHGCTRDAMFVTMFVNVLTVIGNAMFLFGLFGMPYLGVEGVAISTVVGRVVALCILIPLVMKRTRTRIVPRFMFVFSRKVIYSVLNIGLPGAGENLAWQTQYMFMTGVIASLGAIPLATQGIYMQLVHILMLLSISIGMGTEILVARYTGSLKLDLANKQLIRSVKIGFIATFLVSFHIPLGTGALLIDLFTDDEGVMALASTLFILTAIMEPGRILNIIIINSLRATGDTKFPVVMALISMWGVSVPLGCFCALYLDMGLLGVWIGFMADEWLRGISMFLRWKTGIWRTKAKELYEKTLQTKNQHASVV